MQLTDPLWCQETGANGVSQSRHALDKVAAFSKAAHAQHLVLYRFKPVQQAAQVLAPASSSPMHNPSIAHSSPQAKPSCHTKSYFDFNKELPQHCLQCLCRHLRMGAMEHPRAAQKCRTPLTNSIHSTGEKSTCLPTYVHL